MKPMRSLLILAVALAACNDNRLEAPGGETPDPIVSPSPMPTFPEVPDPPEQYLGTEFWAADLDQFYMGPFQPNPRDAQFAVTVSNPGDEPAEITIASELQTITTASVGPGEVKAFPLPMANLDGTGIQRAAYRIRSSIPVTAHQFNPLNNVLVYSNDASLLLPATALGTEYRVLTWPQYGPIESRGYVSILATAEGPTNVEVTVASSTLAGGDLPALIAGQTITRTLYPFDVLTIQTADAGNDLSGTRVLADRPVSVFGGTEMSYVPLGVCCGDHLEEQMPPLVSWGREFFAGRSKPRVSEPDFWRVLAAEDGTTVTTDPPQPGTPAILSAGQVLDFSGSTDFRLTASAPVLLGQFLAGEDIGAGTGDPAFTLVPPREQLRYEQMFLTPQFYDFDFIVVVAPAGTFLELDGQVLNPVWVAIPGGWAKTSIDVADGPHRLRATQPTAVTVMGYSQYVSYAYSGGLNLVPQ